MPAKPKHTRRPWRMSGPKTIIDGYDTICSLWPGGKESVAVRGKLIVEAVNGYKPVTVGFKIKNSWPRQPWRGKVVEVRIKGWKRPLQVTIYTHTDYDAKEMVERIAYYKVNWSALGSMKPEEAAKYANAILVACHEANKLTKLYAGRRWR